MELAQRPKMECFGKFLTMFSRLKYLRWFWICQVLNVLEFWILPKFSYRKMTGFWIVIMEVLNIPGFWIYEVSAYASFAWGSEYAWIWLSNALWKGCKYIWSTFHRVLNKLPVLNILVLRLWEGCKYVRVTQQSIF